uniref:Uncharacterized protein n=1 Tax=Setaria viridis TaxID=4556 RepID=A0A4U6W101_SETVI|nr:hypothetical protein SEVIR_2G384350v2 [Setaria viridis]
MPTISRCSGSTVAGGIGGSMLPGRVPTEWPELVGRPYLLAHEVICRERPDVYIEELGAAETVPPGPRDEHRVRVFINHFYIVVAPAPTVG